MTRSGDPAVAPTVRDASGRLWRPRPGASVSWEQFTAAREYLLELWKLEDWNPWLREQDDPKRDEAMSTLETWERAEPGFTQMTMEEVEARLQRVDERARVEQAAERARFEARRGSFDAGRHHARLALLEKRSQLTAREAKLRGTDASAAANVTHRGDAEAEATITELRRQVRSLEATVGDPEEVIDERGRLPADRRVESLALFSARRRARVRELQALAGEDGKPGKTDQRAAADRRGSYEHDFATLELNDLLGLPPLQPADMCADCAHPASWHMPAANRPHFGPCPAWPEAGAHLRETLSLYRSAAARAHVPTAPRPQPLAVVSVTGPIADVVAALQRAQEEHPDATVKHVGKKLHLMPVERREDPPQA